MYVDYAGDEEPDSGSDGINQKLFLAIVQGNWTITSCINFEKLGGQSTRDSIQKECKTKKKTKTVNVIVSWCSSMASPSLSCFHV